MSDKVTSAAVPSPPDSAEDLARISAAVPSITASLREMWAYRELALFLIWRDVSVRYRQTVLGITWAVLQPLLTMAVFTVILGRLVRVPSDGVPHPIFAFCGLLPWQLFAYALTSSANSLVANERLVTKVYFPRSVLPVATVLAGLVDFAVAFGVLLAMMWWYGVPSSGRMLMLPALVLLALATALAVGIWLSALNVRYRDVRHTLPFLTQIWMFATPIAYPASLVPERWRAWYGLNPMAGVVEGFRWAMLNGPAPGPMLVVSSVVVLLGLWLGLWYFLRVERTFADVI